jgi:hypothetical protein
VIPAAGGRADVVVAAGTGGGSLDSSVKLKSKRCSGLFASNFTIAATFSGSVASFSCASMVLLSRPGFS